MAFIILALGLATIGQGSLCNQLFLTDTDTDYFLSGAKVIVRDCGVYEADECTPDSQYENTKARWGEQAWG